MNNPKLRPEQRLRTAGNELTKVGAGGALVFEWDGANRCTAIATTDGQITLAYDGLNRWTHITQCDSDCTNIVADRWFVWDGTRLAEERASNGDLVQRFYANGFSRNGTNYFYVRDHLGSVRQVLDQNGTTVAKFQYDPYGRRTQTLGTMWIDYGYAGLFELPNGLKLAVWRIYDPTTGRWINRNPIRESGGWNMYAYCGGEPVNGVDPSGYKVHLYVDPIHRNIFVRFFSALAANKYAQVDWDAQYGANTFVLVAHSSTDQIGDFRDTTQLAKYLTTLPDFKNAKRVLLIACDTGKPAANGSVIAKTLAQTINLEVIAPTDKVSIDWFDHLIVENNGKMAHFQP